MAFCLRANPSCYSQSRKSLGLLEQLQSRRSSKKGNPQKKEVKKEEDHILCIKWLYFCLTPETHVWSWLLSYWELKNWRDIVCCPPQLRLTELKRNRQIHNYNWRFQHPISITDRTATQKIIRYKRTQQPYQSTESSGHL